MIGGKELVVGGKSRRLGKLGGEGVDPLAHHAGHRVVNLAEVEGHHLVGQHPHVALSLLPHSRPKAAVLNQT